MEAGQAAAEPMEVGGWNASKCDIVVEYHFSTTPGLGRVRTSLWTNL